MNEEQKQTVTASAITVKSFAAIGGSTAILTGNPILFLHLVNSVQEVYILKYIPINWTDKNLWIFEIINAFSIQRFPTPIKYDSTDYIMISSPAFMQFSQDAFFLRNMQAFFFIAFVLLLFYGIFMTANHNIQT
jgi:hypothetical protein